MKKSILVLGPFLFSLALQGKVQEIMKPAKPVVKTVQFSVFAGSSYSNVLYNQLEGKVLLSVWKYNGNCQELLWQCIVDEGKLKDYPGSDKAIFREVSIYGISERKETLVAGYEVIYDTKGSKMFYNKGKILPVGDKDFKLNISI
jgi:hypothetical protein